MYINMYKVKNIKKILKFRQKFKQFKAFYQVECRSKLQQLKPLLRALVLGLGK